MRSEHHSPLRTRLLAVGGLAVAPCSGTGTVSFTPVPTSVSARAGTVTVEWVSESAGPGPLEGS
jgi:hypothetical protein